MLGTALVVALAAVAAAVPTPPAPGAAAPSPLLDRARYSLWEGAPAPAALPAALDPGAPDAEAASALSAHRFDLAGLRDAVASPRPPSGAFPAGAVPLAALAPRVPGDLVVSVELDLALQTPLKDSLDALAKSAAFRPDARFEPTWLGARRDRVAVWGWMPGAKLAEALRIKGVTRVAVAREHPRAPDEPLRGDFVVGIRVRAEDPGPIGGTFSRVVRELSGSADFRWRRTVGYQGIPGSRDLALIVVGDAPLRRLGDLMAHPDVVKVLPSPDAAAARLRPDSGAPRESFVSYALLRAPVLVALTVLLVLGTALLRRR